MSPMASTAAHVERNSRPGGLALVHAVHRPRKGDPGFHSAILGQQLRETTAGRSGIGQQLVQKQPVETTWSPDRGVFAAPAEHGAGKPVGNPLLHFCRGRR